MHVEEYGDDDNGNGGGGAGWREGLQFDTRKIISTIHYKPEKKSCTIKALGKHILAGGYPYSMKDKIDVTLICKSFKVREKAERNLKPQISVLMLRSPICVT